MLHIDYTFEIFNDGTLVLDPDIKEIPSAKDGDIYILRQSESGRWVFRRKVEE